MHRRPGRGFRMSDVSGFNKTVQLRAAKMARHKRTKRSTLLIYIERVLIFAFCSLLTILLSFLTISAKGYEISKPNPDMVMVTGDQFNGFIKDAYTQGLLDSKSAGRCVRYEGGSRHYGGPVLIDGDVCYVGPQIDPHLSEVDGSRQRLARQLESTSAALTNAAKRQNIVADDSWRSFALLFAKTSGLPMAREAGRQAYIAHGGDGHDFDMETMPKPKTSPRPPVPRMTPVPPQQPII